MPKCNVLLHFVMLLLHFSTCAYLFSPEKGSCSIFSTRNNCCEFLAFYGVFTQRVIQPRINDFEKYSSFKSYIIIKMVISPKLSDSHKKYFWKNFGNFCLFIDFSRMVNSVNYGSEASFLKTLKTIQHTSFQYFQQIYHSALILYNAEK